MKTLLWVILLLGTAGVHAAEISGVHFDDKTRLSAGGPELVLNGGGTRTFILFKVYAGALYVEQKSTNPQAIIDAQGPRRVHLVMLRDVSAKQFSEALNEGLQANHTPQQIARFQSEIDQLLGLMQSIGELKKGDQVQVDYLPEVGTRIQVKGETKGKEIAGLDFYRMILRVWLGDKPADAGLKEGMLGGS